MPKLKTKRGVKKRFKVTANGKVKYSKAFRRHILTSKAVKRKRQLRGPGILAEVDAKRIIEMIH